MRDKAGKELSLQEIRKKALNRIRNILLEFEVMLLHCIGKVPSHHIRRFFYRLSGITIDKGSTIHTGAKFYDPKNIKIGKDSVVGEDSVLDGRAPLVIGNHVDIASGVMIYNCEHDIQSDDFHSITEPVIIDDYVFIGPHAVVLPGVRIGKGSVVGAGAVVTKDVQPFVIVGGVPAKPIGERAIKDLHYRLGRARWFR